MEIPLILDPSGLPFRSGPPTASLPRRAGAYRLASNEERHTVQGGGASLLEVKPGDRITVTNAEGGQRCELLAAHLDGRVDASVLGWSAEASGDDLRATVNSALDRVRQFLGRELGLIPTDQDNKLWQFLVLSSMLEELYN